MKLNRYGIIAALVIGTVMVGPQTVLANDSGLKVFNIPGAFRMTSGNGYRFNIFTIPGSVSTRAFGINETDQIVGDFVDPNGEFHGFLYKNCRQIHDRTSSIEFN